MIPTLLIFQQIPLLQQEALLPQEAHLPQEVKVEEHPLEEEVKVKAPQAAQLEEVEEEMEAQQPQTVPQEEEVQHPLEVPLRLRLPLRLPLLHQQELLHPHLHPQVPMEAVEVEMEEAPRFGLDVFALEAAICATTSFAMEEDHTLLIFPLSKATGVRTTSPPVSRFIGLPCTAPAERLCLPHPPLLWW